MPVFYFTRGVFDSLSVVFIANRRSVAVLCVMYKIRCNLMHPHYGALPVPCVPAGYMTHIRLLMRLFAAEPRSIPGPLFLS